MSLATPSVVLNEAGQIDDDLPCVGCDYNLRGLGRDGMCPECGSDVQRAIWVAKLRWHDPRWLKRMGSASFWISVAVVCYITLILLPKFFGESYTIPVIMIVLPVATGAVVSVYGLWIATTGDPTKRHLEHMFSLRKLIRFFFITGVTLFVVATPILAYRTGGLKYEVHIFFSAVILTGLGILFTYLHGYFIAKMIDHKAMARRVLAMGIIAGVTIAAVASMWLINAYATDLYANFNIELWFLNEYLDFSLIVLEYMTLFLAFSGLFLAWWYRRRLYDAAAQARRRAELYAASAATNASLPIGAADPGT